MVDFLLDANVFITAHRDYYPSDRVPQFWDWLAKCAADDKIGVPYPIWKEIHDVYPVLSDWLNEVEDDFLIADADADGAVGEILDMYAEDLSEEEVFKIGADSFLVSYSEKIGCTVVTKEVSKITKTRANRHLPDICDERGVKWINDHELIRILDFKA